MWVIGDPANLEPPGHITLQNWWRPTSVGYYKLKQNINTSCLGLECLKHRHRRHQFQQVLGITYTFSSPLELNCPPVLLSKSSVSIATEAETIAIQANIETTRPQITHLQPILASKDIQCTFT